MELSRILVARRGNLAFVKVVGRGSFQNAGCLKSFYQQLLKDKVDRFVVDLDACTYLDSTFLGTLLILGKKLGEVTHGEGFLHILNASTRNLELMKNVGLDRLFKIDGKPPELNEIVKEETMSEVPCPIPSREEAAPTILEAHEKLMEFDQRNVPKFKDVVEFLREDLGQSSS